MTGNESTSRENEGDNAPTPGEEADGSFDECQKEDDIQNSGSQEAEDLALTKNLEECALDLLAGGDANDEFSVLSLIRCAAHCLNLAVKDSLTDPTTSALLQTYRKLCKKLRSPQAARLLRQQGLVIPLLDCETRWGSTADMLEMLFKLKDFSLRNMAKLKLFLSSSDFEKLESVLTCLRPARKLCIHSSPS